MSETLKIQKCNALPVVLEPNTMYLVKVSDVVQIHITDNIGTSAYQSSSSTADDALEPFLFLGVSGG